MFDLLKKTLKSSIIYGAGTVSSKLVGFILIPLYTSYLSISDYGILSIVEITATFLTAIISLRINAAFFRWYYDKEYTKKQKSIFFTSFVLLLGVSIIGLGIFWSFSENFSTLIFNSPKYSYLVILMFISSGLQVSIDLVLYLMRLQDKAIFYSSGTILKLIVSLLLIILFVTVFDRGIEGIYESVIISQLFFLLFTSKYIIENSKFKIELVIFLDMLKFSLPLVMAELSGIILTISDRYCLNFLSSTAEVGVYSLGFKISNTIRVFIYSSVMLAVAPLIYKYIDNPNNKRFYSKLLTYFAFGTTLATVIISIFSKNIIHLIAKDQSYWGSISLIPIISFAILFGIIKDVSLTGLNITKRTSIIAITVSIIAILNLILNLVLIPYFDSFGAAYATLISRIISFIIFYKIAQKYYFIPYELKKVILVIFVGIIITGISFVIAVQSLYIELFIKTILIICFPIALYYLNFFEEIELTRIKQTWMLWRNPLNWVSNIKKIKF